uniref:Uncharacterized protein n=1 Tax=virus sp. ctE0n6 TaxID=2827985 RepID=A0A8S5RG51_9VIRU|nr:MAG TPA: hypothetical protein [virus sp. ctE0n6]
MFCASNGANLHRTSLRNSLYTLLQARYYSLLSNDLHR